MKFEPNVDQATFLSVLEQFAASREAGWRASAEWKRFDWSAELDAKLEQNGFFDCAAEESLGPVTAAAMIARLARMPVLVECAASAMLRPMLCPELPRPLAIIEGDRSGAIRFLPVARSAIALEAGQIRVAVLKAGSVKGVDSLFAYPVGVLTEQEPDWMPLKVEPDAVRNAWRVAVAAEISGALQGSLDAVVEHVRHRRQFGRPLGSFQAIQHRLAETACKIDGAYWLTMKAAQNLANADAAIALGYAQQISARIVRDLHQFMGAMGLTLEHPLHRWTYRVRLLWSALGGSDINMRCAAERLWGEA